MTTLDKIKAEIEQIKPWDLPCDKREPEHIRDMALEIIDKYAEQEPCDDAQERYEDLCEYFGDAKDILKSRKDFKAWLERIKWHIHKAEELHEKYEHKQEPCEDTVSRGVFEQVKWERDIAIDQLNELGYELGQKIEPYDDVVSRQAVEEIINDIRDCISVEGYWAILERLKKLHSVQRTSNADKKHVENTLDDAISRQAVLDEFWQLEIELRPSAIDAITNMIEQLPSVQPKSAG